MVGITLSPEQIRAAPPDVRRWIEHELAVSLGLNPPALPITQSSSPHLAACSPEEAAQVLSLIQGMLPVVHVFFEFGREGAAPGEGIEAFRLADVMRHARLEVPDQVLACLEVLDQAVQRVRNDPGVTFHAVDERGYCLVAAQTQRSIRAIWQQLVAQREPVRPAVSSPTEGPLSARLAPDLSPGVSSFLTASRSGPARWPRPRRRIGLALPHNGERRHRKRLPRTRQWRRPSTVRSRHRLRGGRSSKVNTVSRPCKPTPVEKPAGRRVSEKV